MTREGKRVVGGAPSGIEAALAAAGERSPSMKGFDWSGTPLGPVDVWPRSLRSAMSICLRTELPMAVWWGPDHLFACNDGFRAALAPDDRALPLGQPGREAMPELWPRLGPALDTVLRGTGAAWSEDDLVHVSRSGRQVEAYFTFSHSPILDEAGGVSGVLTAATETTGRVIDERRLRTLGELARTAASARTAAEAAAAGAASLAHDAGDVPFALLYLLSEDWHEARLAWAPEWLHGGTGAPDVVPAGEPASWPLWEVARSGRAAEVAGVVGRVGAPAPDAGPESPDRALVIPLPDPAREGRAGAVLVAGLSPMRAVDDGYRVFLDLAAAQIAAAIADASAREEQRRQAEARAELIEEVARTLASTLDLQVVLEKLALGAARMASGVQPGRALVLRPHGREGAVAVAYATDGARASFHPALQRHVQYVMRSGQPLVFAFDQVGTATERRRLADAGVGSVALVPIPVGEERFGVLAVGATDERALGPDQLRRLALLADLSGLAIANATAYEREHRALQTSQQRLRELTLLHDATRTFSATLSVEAIEREVVRTAARLVSQDGSLAGRATFLRIDGQVATVVHELDGAGPAQHGTSFSLAAHPAVAAAVAERQAQTARGAAAADGLRTVFAPVFVQDQPYGIVAVAARDDAGLDDEVLRRLQAIASLAELAIANARHFDAVRREGEHMAALEEVKSKFLRLASHELRSPLAVLRGYLSMLEDGTFEDRPDELNGIYAILAGKAGQMEMLVTQMLEAARLEEGRLRLDLRRLDLRQPVQEAFDGARLMAGPAHDLRLEMPAGAVLVVADGWRVTTIVANLLDNAVKYSPDGGLVRCLVRADRGTAVVEVADQGLGIAEVDMPTLFTRFGRIVTRENSHIQGTGLGLYLSRELAHVQSGTVTAASEAGVGSTFTLTIPLA